MIGDVNWRASGRVQVWVETYPVIEPIVIDGPVDDPLEVEEGFRLTILNNDDPKTTLRIELPKSAAELIVEAIEGEKEE